MGMQIVQPGNQGAPGAMRINIGSEARLDVRHADGAPLVGRLPQPCASATAHGLVRFLFSASSRGDNEDVGRSTSIRTRPPEFRRRAPGQACG